MAIEQEIRQYLAKRYQCDPDLDIQVHGDVVEVRGVMPNTHAYGQLQVGHLGDVESEMRRHQPAVAAEA